MTIKVLIRNTASEMANILILYVENLESCVSECQAFIIRKVFETKITDSMKFISCLV